LPTRSVLTNEYISDADTASPFFTPDVTGTYVVRLTIGDGQAYDCDNVAVLNKEYVALPCEGNFNHDGDVDGSDLAVFAEDFGRTE